MQIFSVIYEGYNLKRNQYATCFLLVQEELCTTAYCYERSIAFEYPICSEIDVESITEDFCAETSKHLLDSFYIARDNGCAFICFVDPLQSKRDLHNIPRFREIDFERLVTELGGRKIPETMTKTPDFLLDGIVLELKDLQQESLFDKGRRQAIAKTFGQLELHTINLDPLANYGELSARYHTQIRNTIQNQIKKASDQIKAFKETNEVKGAGLILLNTGMFSLPDKLFRSMVTHILTHQTKTIEFAYVFSQLAQSNGFDSVADFHGDFIGNVPESAKALSGKVSELIEEKMTASIFSPNQEPAVHPQHAISFFADHKIFYWNPGGLPDSRRGGY
jgi:hypothetical protein